MANNGTSVNRKDLIKKQATQAHKFHLSEHDKSLIPNQAFQNKIFTNQFLIIKAAWFQNKHFSKTVSEQHRENSITTDMSDDVSEGHKNNIFHDPWL